MQSFQDIEHFVKTLSAAIKKKIPTKVSQLTNDVGYKTTDTNTTYKLSKSGSTVTLTGSDGSTTSVADSNTTYSSLKNPYSLDIQNNGNTVASYDGSTAKTANFTNATTSANGLMSAADKSKLDGIGAGSNVKSVNGKTGAVSLSKADVGLGNVDNTSDADKHVRANNIQWGGNNIVNDISPLDVATSNLFAGNIMAYSKPAGITVEYSTDGGTTWADYGASDESKIRLVTPEVGGVSYYLGKKTTAQVATKDLLRITLNAPNMGIYCTAKNLLIYIADNGGTNCYVNIEYSTRATSTVFHNYGRYTIAGWSGWNSIPINSLSSFGTNGRGDQPVNIRLTFGFTSYRSGYESKTAFDVINMSMIASNRWGAPSQMARTNSLYAMDKDQNATFPAKVTATSFSGATATSSADGLMSKSDKSKLDGIGAGSNVKSVNSKTGAVTLTKSDIGLSNVDNTADSAKSVKYAASAGSANTVAWGNVSGKPSTYPPSSHTHTPAQVGLGNVANLDQSKAIKSITRSGTTFTATALDGTTSTFTQQDNNTTYGAATQSANGLMSAADKKAVDREFFRMLPKGGTVIPNGANLNSTAYLKVGNYYQSAIVNTTNMTNIPIKSAFMMYVLSPLSEAYDNESTGQWVYRLRIFVEYTGSSIFTQNVYSGNTAGSFSYGSWVKMTNSNDLGAVSNTINTHIDNKSNPHGVTKAQVGLGNVANLDQSKAIKSITRSGTTFTATALDGTTTTFTQQDSNTTYGVATSSSDGLMSKSDKAKLDGISSGADAVTIKTVKVNGTALTPDSNKAVNVTVPILANNATTTTSGMALDARMGKTLSDQIAAVKTGAIDQIVNLTAAGWTGDAAPYSQTVNVTGMTDELLCELFSACPKSATVAEREAYNEAFALVASGYAETADGSATFLVDEKPAIDIGVRIKSISKANAVSDQTSSDITNAVDAMSNTMWEKIYPIGSIYISANSTSPAELFGGTWEQIKDRFLLAAGNTYAAGSTGGEATHTLTVDEMPKHRHSSDSYQSGYSNSIADKSNYCTWVNRGTSNNNDPGMTQNGPVRTSLVGGSQPHNNMPPYLAVYIWKRVS